MKDSFVEDCLRVRRQSPLILNITNYVAMNLSANALLAVGASPIMSSEAAEMEELVRLSAALVVNTGCLEQKQIGAMRLAAGAARSLGKPWVLDPVGAGISRMRSSVTRELIRDCRPSLIRGNCSEIGFLAGADIASHGVDAVECDTSAAEAVAKRLALATGAVVSVSGPVDVVTDGRKVFRIFNGSPVMPRVTAMGCTASALSAAFLAVEQDTVVAAAAAMALMGLAGERAAAVTAGPGSFVPAFIDAIASFDPVEASKSLHYEEGTA